MQTPPPQTIADLLLRAAQHHPDSGIRYCLGGAAAEFQDQSHPELLDDARRVLTGLRAQGLRPHDKVVLILERPQEFLTAFWAAVLGGCVPCPMAPLRADPERWAAQLTHVNTLLDNPLVVTSESLAADLPPVAGLDVVPLERLYCAKPAIPYTAAPEDTAVLVLTSGSTGNSKAVMLSHTNLVASMAGKNGHHRLTAADTTLNWVSFDHVAALLECHLLPLSTGSRQLHVEPPVVIGEPLEFLRLASRHGVTMTFTPNFLLGMLNSSADRLTEAGEELDLTRLRHIISGGEAVVCATGETFLDRYAPHGLARNALWPAFGMTETCAGSVYSRAAFPDIDRGKEFAGLGTPVEGLRIRIADPADRELPAGEVGELQLIGPMITRGYYRNARATAMAFTADGWFRSGDLGRIDGGRLALVGRCKDSIIINGVNYFSHELETALEQLDGVTDSYLAAFPVRPAGNDTEQLVIAFHADAPADDPAALHRVLTAVRSSVVMHWGIRPSLLLPLAKDAFPKSSLGKIQRSLMRRRLESGAYDTDMSRVADLTLRMLGGYTAPVGRTEETLAEIYAEMFDTDATTISATANFFDLGGTSLDILRLRSKVAQRFGVSGLEIVTVLTAPTVRALAAWIGEQTGADGRSSTAERQYDPIVPMQTSGTKTPLFCVHPGVGEVLVFVNLAKYFVGDRPFYALRARGFNDGEKPHATFEQMVDSYVAAIRGRQPHGPYAVAGYSYGGVVAFEIAKALESQGERVDFVGSFNLPPHIKYRMEELDFVETATSLAFFLALIDKKQSLELPGKLRALPEEEQLERIMALASPERLAELDLGIVEFGAWADLADRLTALGRTYEPGGSVESVKVFHATPLRGSREDWLHNELRRWDQYTRSPNRYIEVPGEHYTLMNPRHVATFQAILRRELDLALGEADRASAARTAAAEGTAGRGETS
ncbi:non-ribosomal peptide synthetase [Streptomyces sp. NBC_00237]|uniref:non-ribosomal peptide synthetase n=1 Tax=Streptomyces sp. NBC_00237 TaxID=2975687 RepID=UPI002257449B|nr:non-ribosomal peptide synthetase [Streptomyces sp. NBC_00237]MCX5203721.1 non-ribosomal peptide synthetase [Streptomyces sp. NBC_00237]